MAISPSLFKTSPTHFTVFSTHVLARPRTSHCSTASLVWIAAALDLTLESLSLYWQPSLRGSFIMENNLSQQPWPPAVMACPADLLEENPAFCVTGSLRDSSAHFTLPQSWHTVTAGPDKANCESAVPGPEDHLFAHPRPDRTAWMWGTSHPIPQLRRMSPSLIPLSSSPSFLHFHSSLHIL